MGIELINFNRQSLYCQWWFAVLTVSIGNRTPRSLFCIENDNNNYKIQFMFFIVKNWTEYPPF